MTTDEFNAAQDELLKDLPPEFQQYVAILAYEAGGRHASYEEVLAFAKGMVANLKPVVDKYTQRLSKEA